jgi:hypothetical protein
MLPFVSICFRPLLTINQSEVRKRMAIGDRVYEAFEQLAAKNYESATIQVSIAVDATAKAKYGKKLGSGKRFCRFIEEHREFIYFVAGGCGPRLVFKNNADIVFGEKGRLSEVLYKFLRNPVIHEGGLADGVVFQEGPVVGHDNGKFIIMPAMLIGTLLCVIGERSNAAQHLNMEIRLEICGRAFPVSQIWGALDRVKAEIGFKP